MADNYGRTLLLQKVHKHHVTNSILSQCAKFNASSIIASLGSIPKPGIYENMLLQGAQEACRAEPNGKLKSNSKQAVFVSLPISHL